MRTIDPEFSAKLDVAGGADASARHFNGGRAVTLWLFTVCALIALMIMLGGYVRLTRSGLSITEWNVITGIVPPLNEAAWRQEFEKYRQTPEYRLINATMTIEGYRRIFYLEYLHRLIGRLAGLVVIIPLAFFLLKGIIPWRRSAVYLGIAGLFGLQGFLGWYMVASGLIDRPHVSHYRLAIHLLMALLLLGLALQTALNRIYGNSRRPSAPGAALLITLLIQIAYGALVAGLKAGGVTDTWPLMSGAFVPAPLFGLVSPWWLDPVESPVTTHFIHRWFAFAVLAITLAIWFRARQRNHPLNIRRGALTLALLVCIQIAAGVSVVLFGVPVSLALFHQGVALVMFAVTIFLNHRLGGVSLINPDGLAETSRSL